MTGKKTNLRKQAEKKAAHLSDDLNALSPEEIRLARHELRVHQIDLEMQNEELRRSQLELDTARARYFDLYDLAPVGYLTLSRHGLILEANLTAKTMMGLTRDELIKRPFTQFIAEEDQAINYRHRKQLVETGGPQAYELRMLKKDSPAFWARLETAVTLDADAAPVYRVVMSDITKTKQVVEDLHISEDRFRKLLEVTPMPICYVNKNGAITFRNAKFVKVFGYSNDDVPSLSEWWLNAYPEAQYRQWVIQNWDSAVRHAAETGTDIEPDVYQVTCKDGSLREIIISGTSIDDNFLATFFDITDRKQAEEALRESEKQYRTLFEATADTVFLIDQETGSLLDVNPAATRMYGFNREEFIRMTTTDVSAEPEKTAKATSEPVPFIPIRYHRHKDGTVFPVELTASIFELRGRNTIIATARDITERKKSEEESKQLELQRQQLQKTESLGRMAGAIAHHFNNQLGVVIGNLEMAIDDMPQGAEPVNSLSAAMQAAWKAAEMSSLMLTYLGQTSGKLELLDLCDVCRRSLPLLKAVIPGDVTMETDLPLPGPIIMANAPQIQQALSNLITNAWEAIGDGRGDIHLRVKTVFTVNIPGAFRFPIDWQLRNNAYACLEVKDNGCGIEEKDIEKLFDPFFSTKFTGRGMGLAVVLGIVRAHGGALTVESVPGRGSIFRVFLPVSDEEVLWQPDKMAQPLAIGGGGMVLLVEDEEMLRDMAAAMLKRLGYSVIEAKDGIEAVEVFRQHRNEIRCVLSDLTMPRMNGWETLTALRKLAPDLPVILASGYDEAHVMAGDHPELPQAFLGKPYSLKGLTDAISQALADMK